MRAVAVLLSVLFVAFVEATCPAGYSTNDKVTCYKLYQDVAMKQNAAAQCKKDGGFLASVQNAFVNTYLTTLVAPASYAWLGIECRNGQKSTCKNDDGKTFGPYDSFTPYDPSTNGDCVYMDTNGPSGVWTSLGCDNQIPFVCEHPY